MAEAAAAVKTKVAFVRKARSGLRVGLAAGHKVTVRTQKAGPGARRGVKSKRVALVRELIRDVCGLAPYEKRILDVIKVRAGRWRRAGAGRAAG